VRILNLHKEVVNFLERGDYYRKWPGWGYEEIEKEFEISSSDLLKVKFSREKFRIVERELDGKLRTTYTRNPSKPKSQMEYRKRAYYGKCKK
jgi:hypothetical protein